MAAIDYSAGPRITNVGESIVYTRSTWLGPWVAQPNLIAVECQWKAAPEFASALLEWRTGAVILPGDSSPTVFGPWIGRGHFVRIDWACEDSSILRWVGYIDSSAWPTEAFGNQPIVCYGLEKALALTPILETQWRDAVTGTYYRSAEPPTFALNRSANPDAGGVYYFVDPRSDDPPAAWSTRQAVAYLMKYNLPTGSSGVANVPWAVDQLTQLPDWDAITLECFGRTVWDVLNELIAPSKQLGMVVGSNGTTAYLRCFTHTASTITVGSQTLAANPTQHTVVFAPDALTTASLQDVGGGYDQVICRGAKRMTICTLEHLTPLVDGWSSTEETAYEAAASADAGYAAANADQKRVMNAAVRSKVALQKVYTRFELDPDWDFELSAEPVFPGNTHPREVRIIDQLPIDPTADWSGTVDPADFQAEPGSPLLLLMANPDDLLKYFDLSKLGLAGDAHTNNLRPHDLAVSAETLRDELHLRIDGGPAHAIAGTNFSKLPVDTADHGGLDYSTMAVTVGLEEDRYCEGRYPTSLPSADIIRRLFVDCGPNYRQIRIHKNTIAGLQPDGTAKKVTASAYLHNDSASLATIAQIIALGAVLTRKRVNWTSLRRISTIEVGDLITTAAGAPVLAPVTSVRIVAATTVDRPSSAPTQSFETFGGTHDPLAVLRRLGLVL